MLKLFNVIFINVLLKFICSQNSIVNLTDSNIESKFDQDTHSKWFLIFITESCPYCKKSYKVLKNEILPEFANDKKIKFGLISCTQNLWTATRFNISKVPHILFVEKEKGKMYEFAGHVSKDAIIDFINEEKTIEDSLPIPKPYTFLTKFSKGFEAIFYEANSFFEGLVEQRLSGTKFYFHWKKQYTYIACSLCFICFVMLEIFVLSFIYGKIKKKKFTPRGDSEGHSSGVPSAKDSFNDLDKKNN